MMATPVDDQSLRPLGTGVDFRGPNHIKAEQLTEDRVRGQAGNESEADRERY